MATWYGAPEDYMINGIIGLSIHPSRRDDGGRAMSAVHTRAAAPSAAYRCHRRRAPASRHPRTRVTRAAAGPAADVPGLGETEETFSREGEPSGGGDGVDAAAAARAEAEASA